MIRISFGIHIHSYPLKNFENLIKLDLSGNLFDREGALYLRDSSKLKSLQELRIVDLEKLIEVSEVLLDHKNIKLITIDSKKEMIDI